MTTAQEFLGGRTSPIADKYACSFENRSGLAGV